VEQQAEEHLCLPLFNGTFEIFEASWSLRNSLPNPVPTLLHTEHLRLAILIQAALLTGVYFAPPGWQGMEIDFALYDQGMHRSPADPGKTRAFYGWIRPISRSAGYRRTPSHCRWWPVQKSIRAWERPTTKAKAPGRSGAFV